MSRNGESSPDFVLKSLHGEHGGVLMRLSLQDGGAVNVCELPAIPVWEGITITDHGLFVALGCTLMSGSSMNFMPHFNLDEVMSKMTSGAEGK